MVSNATASSQLSIKLTMARPITVKQRLKQVIKQDATEFKEL